MIGTIYKSNCHSLFRSIMKHFLGIWRDSAGKVDVLVAGIGTGGTVTVAGNFLKEKNPEIKVHLLISMLASNSVCVCVCVREREREREREHISY